MKIVLKEEQIKELELMLAELPYKYASNLLNYLSKFVEQEEQQTVEE